MSDHEGEDRPPSSRTGKSKKPKRGPLRPGNFLNSSTAVLKIFASVQPPSISRQFGSPTIAFLVGEEGSEKSYYIHSAFLAEKAPYLSTLVPDRLVHGEPYHVVGVETWVFEQFIMWLYQGRIEVPERRGIRGYSDFFNLAFNYNLEELRNLIIDETRKYCVREKVLQDILHICQGSEDEVTGEMENFFWDQMIWELLTYTGDHATLEEYLHDFLEGDTVSAIRLVQSLLLWHEGVAWGEIVEPARLLGCQYHEHLETPACDSEDQTDVKNATTSALAITKHKPPSARLRYDWTKTTTVEETGAALRRSMTAAKRDRRVENKRPATSTKVKPAAKNSRRSAISSAFGTNQYKTASAQLDPLQAEIAMEYDWQRGESSGKYRW